MRGEAQNSTPDRMVSPGNGRDVEQELMKIMTDAAGLGLTKNKNFMKLALPALINHSRDLIALMKRQVDQEAFLRTINRFPFEQPSSDVSRIDPGGRPLLLGSIYNDENRPLIYPVEYLNQHMLILGASGTGKTSLLYSIALQLMQYGIPVLLFDQKLDYRHLKRFKLARNIIVVRVQKMPTDFPKPPPGVDPLDWMVLFSTIFCKYFDLLSGSENFLIPIVHALYDEFGVFDGSDTYPTMWDLLDKIEGISLKGNSYAARFKHTVRSRLQSYLSLLGEASKYSQGVPIEWLAQKSIVFELGGLTEHVARFYVAMIIQKIFKYRIANGQRGNSIRNVIIADECKYLTPPGYNQELGFSPLTTLLSQAREAGIGMVLADQTAELEPAVFVNSKLKISFRLGSGSDIGKVARSFSLSKEQEQYITRLGTGEGIVRIPGEEPFVIRTFPVNIE